MNKIRISMDIGGSNTSIFLKGQGVVFKEPTLISVKKYNKKYKLLSFGINCQQNFGKENENILTFSPVSEGIVKSADYLTLYLKYALTKIIKNIAFSKIDCLLSIPCAISNSEASQYKLALQNCGVKNIELIRSPICSFLSEEKTSNTPSHLMIIDIGGSKTDVAIVNTNNIVKGATLGFGGRAIDNSIKTMIENEFNLIITNFEAEKLKNQIGSLLPNDMMSFDVTGLDKIDLINRSIPIYSKQLYPILNTYFLEILKVVKATLIHVNEEIQQQILYNGIVLTGGVCALTGICDYIKNQIGIKAKLHSHFENSVILGLGKL